MVNRVNRPQQFPKPHTQPGSGIAPGFQEVLAGQLRAVKFSGHAQQRLTHADRTLSPTELSRLERAVAQAAAKGARQSLILMQDLALVVSVVNRTVVTAVTQERMQEQVFTQIDSAVIT